MIREDLRSGRMAVIPDCLVNPGSALYAAAAVPASTEFAGTLMERGWGIMQMPPHVAPAASCERLVEATVGDIVDYRKNGYAVVIVGLDGLPQQGVWLDAMKGFFAALGKDLPPVVTVGADVSAADADRLVQAVATAA